MMNEVIHHPGSYGNSCHLEMGVLYRSFHPLGKNGRFKTYVTQSRIEEGIGFVRTD